VRRAVVVKGRVPTLPLSVRQSWMVVLRNSLGVTPRTAWMALVAIPTETPRGSAIATCITLLVGTIGLRRKARSRPKTRLPEHLISGVFMPNSRCLFWRPLLKIESFGQKICEAISLLGRPCYPPWGPGPSHGRVRGCACNGLSTLPRWTLRPEAIPHCVGIATDGPEIEHGRHLEELRHSTAARSGLLSAACSLVCLYVGLFSLLVLPHMKPLQLLHEISKAVR
jgi:hypothetical protein